ncbi:MAG: 16S rRNA (adenine(1518)-N(6)/adenine(1519)-N(6))-dimethyltransferase RsmA [bacterium]
MDLTDIPEIKRTLKAYGAYPQKDLGQHFLIDHKIIETIVDAADIKSDQLVLEVGPGMGILTQELCKKAKEVLAIELDRSMIAIVKTSCIKYHNLRVENVDILKYNTDELGEYKVVANLPYYITSAVIRLFLESSNKPEELVLLVQREVAERICAKPSRMSVLAVSVQFYGNPSIVDIVPRTAFFPAPKVDSAVLKIKSYKNPLFDVDNRLFFRIVKAGFHEKRKQLINSLSGGLLLRKDIVEVILNEAAVSPQARAESLAMIDWYNIYKAYLKIHTEEYWNEKV